MKRFISTALLLIIAVGLLASCGEVGETSSQGEGSSAVQTSSSAPESGDETSSPESSQPDQISAESSETVNLPEYVPGSIELIPRELDEFDFERKYRRVYYTVDQSYIEYLGKENEESVIDWLQNHAEEHGFGESQEEMLIVTFIKHYNIPRKDFEKLVEELATARESMGVNVLDELYEIPNVDIIYTFDNEIINNYYRYA